MMLNFDLCPKEEKELYDLAFKLKSAYILYNGWEPETGKIPTIHVQQAYNATVLEDSEGKVKGANGTLNGKIMNLFSNRDR